MHLIALDPHFHGDDISKEEKYDINFSVTADGELALPLVLDVETILSSDFGMSMATPFSIRVSILSLQSGGYIWTTGDMAGFADDSGNLYDIDDPNMTNAVGTYTPSSATTGSYLFTGGTYIEPVGEFGLSSRGGQRPTWRSPEIKWLREIASSLRSSQ